MPFWMIAVEWAARFILAGLVGLSIWSVTIIIDRKKYFSSLAVADFVAQLKATAQKFSADKVDQALSKQLFNRKKELEKGISVLGTLGSTTPFIGLLGTILGIIVAFGELSQGKADTNAIMFALAEALVLTAVGLFVAIPAVIAFNIFTKKIRTFFDEVASEVDDFLAGKDN